MAPYKSKGMGDKTGYEGLNARLGNSPKPPASPWASMLAKRALPASPDASGDMEALDAAIAKKMAPQGKSSTNALVQAISKSAPVTGRKDTAEDETGIERGGSPDIAMPPSGLGGGGELTPEMLMMLMQLLSGQQEGLDQAPPSLEAEPMLEPEGEPELSFAPEDEMVFPPEMTEGQPISPQKNNKLSALLKAILGRG